MDCFVYRDKETQEINKVLAPNGQVSLLYKDLLKAGLSKEDALQQWAKTLTPSFQQSAGHLDYDENGEPVLNEEILGQKLHNEAGAFFDIGLAFASTPTPPQGGLTNLIALKKKIINNTRNKIAALNTEIRNTKDNKDLKATLIRKRDSLSTQLEGRNGMVNELTKLKKIDTRSPELIAPFVEKEFKRLDKLVSSFEPASYAEANEIADFIIRMGNFNLNEIKRNPHPIYDEAELFSEKGEFLFTTMREPFDEWATRARAYKETYLAPMSMNLFMQNADNNKVFENLNGRKLTYDEITNSLAGMKDLDWVTSMVMDISAGIFSHNGLTTQMAMKLTNDKFEEHAAWAKNDVHHPLDHIHKDVVKELKAMGHDLKFIGRDGVSYNLFKQQYADGNETGNILEKYTPEFSEAERTMRYNFYKGKVAADKAIDEEKAKKAYNKAYVLRNRWINQTALTLNPSLIPEITSMPEWSHIAGDAAESSAHVADIKRLVGDKYYDKLVKDVKANLKEYLIDRSIQMDALNNKPNTVESELSEGDAYKLKVWDAINSPIVGIDYLKSGKKTTVGDFDFHNELKYNNYIPKSENHYDKNFATIENNETLSKFYDIIYNATDKMKSLFDHDIQNTMPSTSIAYIEKNAADIILDSKSSIPVTAWQAVSKSFRSTFDRIIDIIGVKKVDSIANANVELNTQTETYKVNDDFIRVNSKKIESAYRLIESKFVNTYNSLVGLRQDVPLIHKFNKETVIRMNNLNQAQLLNALRPYIGTMDVQQVIDNYGSVLKQKGKPDEHVIAVGKILVRNAKHQIAQEKSFDLPKIVKLYADLASQYAARRELLPVMQIIKEHYESVKALKTDSIGRPIQIKDDEGKVIGLQKTGGVRNKANAQFDDWMERVILGKYGLRKHYGVSDHKKLLTTEERAKKKELTEAIAKEQNDDRRKALEYELDNLGKNWAVSGVIDGILAWVRFMGLGFNFSSGISNFLEGQIANHATASLGTFFNPQDIYTVTPTDMFISDLRARAGKQFMTPKVAQLKTLTHLYDVLQDNSNELQKASAQSAFAGVRSKLNPYYQIKKTEEYNQSPLLAAMLKNTKITGKDGTVSNVWDAMQTDLNGKTWEIKLQDNFRTEENIKSWEQANGADYRDFKAAMTRVLQNTHGDFSKLGGMQAKSFHAGQIALMFKTWLPREFYKRFAVEQDDTISGIKGFKGTYRSHTALTATLHGAAAGLLIGGPVTALFGAATGYIGGKIFGTKTESSLAEAIYVGKTLARKMIGMPVNNFSRLIGKGNAINVYGDQKEVGDKLIGDKFSAMDLANLKSNIQNIGTLFLYTGLLLLIKGALWDDDEDESEETKTRRQWHNLLANRVIGISGQATMYVNLLKNKENLQNIALFKFFENAGKAGDAVSSLLQGDDTKTSGDDRGGSKTLGAFSKILVPNVFSDIRHAGFSNQSERQFQTTPFDKTFRDDEKAAEGDIKEIRSQRAKELQDAGWEKEDVQKQLRSEFPRKEKDETYVELRERIKAANSQLQDVDNLQQPDSEEDGHSSERERDSR